MTQKKKHMHTDVIIVGGGLAGLTMAALLGRAGVDVACIDKAPPADQTKDAFDVRATALSYATKQVMTAAGVWDDLAPAASPILDIRVADGASPLFLHFDAAAHGTGQPFGWNLENIILRRGLLAAVRRQKKNVLHLAPASIASFTQNTQSAGVVLDDGTTLTAPLLIGADGRDSAVRNWLGIEVEKSGYGQTAIACTIAHERDHENIAVEHFLPGGPFAILPLPDDDAGRHRSSVIWSVADETAKALTTLPRADFDAALQEKCGPHLGTVSCISAPRGYPLALMHAKRYTGPRTALMAEAAHVIHPIAGQGLNLSLRDAALLSELVVDRLYAGLDIGAESLLSAYENIRRADTQLMAGFTDILNTLFSSHSSALGLARHLGLGFVQKAPFLKDFFARHAMGLAGHTGRIVRTGRL